MTKKFVEWAYGSLPPEKANVIILGIPLGKDAEGMLSSLREVSDFVDVFDVDRKVNMLEKIKIADVGNIGLKNLEDITNEVRKIVDANKFPLIIGKSHLLSLYTVKAFPKDTKIVNFDAHGDIKDKYTDGISNESLEPLKVDREFAEKYNYVTRLRRISEINGTDKIAMVGFRDCDQEEFEFVEDNNILYFTPTRIREDIESVKEKLREFVKDSNVYISLDIDVFDPSIGPAVDNPEPNGLIFSEFLELIDEVCKGNVVGMDLVEIKPFHDNKITEYLAIEAIFQVLSRVIKQ